MRGEYWKITIFDFPRPMDRGLENDNVTVRFAEPRTTTAWHMINEPCPVAAFALAGVTW
jgi:hypothetical protein